ISRWKAARAAARKHPAPPPAEPAPESPALAEVQQPPPAPAPVQPVVKPGKLLVRVPGAEVRITGAAATGSDVDVAGKSGAFNVVNDADGWSVAVRYKRAGAGLLLTVESTPPALVYFEDNPIGRAGTFKVGTAAPAQVVFRRPSGGEFALIVKYAP